MIRIHFLQGGVVVHSIQEDRIERYRVSGQKLISDDFFMNEPANVEVTMIADDWLASCWETQTVKVGGSVWLKLSVEVWMQNADTGLFELMLTGLIDLTRSTHEPFKYRMTVVVYDYSALLAELDLPVRICYPYSPTSGVNRTRFIINYALPGEEEEEGAPEVEGEPHYPYAHTIETRSRQVAGVIEALTQIWREYFAELWPLDFVHAYNEGFEGDDNWVQNYVVALSAAESFYRAFVLGVAGEAWSHHSEGYEFGMNYGLISAADRSQLRAEFGIYPTVACDVFFILRAGNNIPDGGYREWYRIYALKGGIEVWDSGQRTVYNSVGERDFGKVGSVSFSPMTYITLDDGESSYRSSENDLEVPAGTSLEDYLGSLAYYVYFNGYLEIPPEHEGNLPVVIDGADTFYDAFIGGIGQPMYTHYKGLSTIYKSFWANYGLIPADERSHISQEYGVYPDDEADAFFIMRAGVTSADSPKDIHVPPGGGWTDPHYPWTDGEGGGGGGNVLPTQFIEKYRIIAVKNGMVVRDYGIMTASGTAMRNGQSLGGIALTPARTVRMGEHTFYQTLPQNPGLMIWNNLIAQNYYLLWCGKPESPAGGWLANRIFRMKSQPGNPGWEQYIELKLKDWLKTMFFLADVSCFADAQGRITIAPKTALDELDIPWEQLITGRKALLVYQPWDQEKLEEVIGDRAEIKYLIRYYGGDRVISHTLELDFIRKGWGAQPQLRQKFLLNSQNLPKIELLGSGWYMVVEVAKEGRKRVKLRAIRLAAQARG